MAFDLVEAAEAVSRVDTSGGLRLLRQVVVAADGTGLTVDTMAADRTIKLLECVLANQDAVLAADTTALKDFLCVLNAYWMLGGQRRSTWRCGSKIFFDRPDSGPGTRSLDAPSSRLCVINSTGMRSGPP